MQQAVSTNLLIYSDDSSLVPQHKDKGEIEKQLNINFANIFDWFVDDNFSIHFGESKTKYIIYSTKRTRKGWYT